MVGPFHIFFSWINEENIVTTANVTEPKNQPHWAKNADLPLKTILQVTNMR